MNNEFDILADFLDHTEGEVEGRGADAPTENLRQQFRQLAGGQLPAAERDRLLAELAHHPDWVTDIAEQVRSLRAPGTGFRGGRSDRSGL